MNSKRRIVVGISGASGAPLALALIRALQASDEIETHLVITGSGKRTLALECQLSWNELRTMVDVIYNNRDIGAAIASGSFMTAGMVIVPCSMKTLAAINHGYSENLLLRAADVMLKERRKLLLVPRESPLSPIHLRNMYELSMLNVHIIPAMLTYYHLPQSIDDMTDHIVGKILDAFDIEYVRFKRWEG